MRLLLDANISWRLTIKLRLEFEDCLHVDHIGLNIPAKDTEIWNYALEHQLLIVTNDVDFLNLAVAKGYPPKVVLLKTGNQSTAFIEALLIKHKAEINALYEAEDYGLLEIF
jgi:predicted nuclease of predicted toxin-antitoxin system